MRQPLHACRARPIFRLRPSRTRRSKHGNAPKDTSHVARRTPDADRIVRTRARPGQCAARPRRRNPHRRRRAAQPYAPYLLAQAVLVQEQALRARRPEIAGNAGAGRAICRTRPTRRRSQRRGRAAFSAACSAAASRASGSATAAANPNPWGGGAAAASGYAPRSSRRLWAPRSHSGGPAAGPWGAPQPQQGGGFLKGALGAAAGVAGGVLLADSLQGLFGGGQASGFLSAAAGLGGGADLAAGLAPAAAARRSSTISTKQPQGGGVVRTSGRR